MAKCGTCNGQGTLTCPSCHGKGGWGSSKNWKQCENCNGSGQATCPTCNGVGYVGKSK